MKIDKYALITVAVITIATVLVIIFYLDPNVYPIFPRCPFFVATGLKCPGCGSQRAIHQLLHLNIKGAFNQNPLVVLFLPYVLFGVYLEYFGGNKKCFTISRMLYGKNASIVLLILIILFWIGRNAF